jgi:hypothetical protein
VEADKREAEAEAKRREAEAEAKIREEEAEAKKELWIISLINLVHASKLKVRADLDKWQNGKPTHTTSFILSYLSERGINVLETGADGYEPDIKNPIGLTVVKLLDYIKNGVQLDAAFLFFTKVPTQSQVSVIVNYLLSVSNCSLKLLRDQTAFTALKKGIQFHICNISRWKKCIMIKLHSDQLRRSEESLSESQVEDAKTLLLELVKRLDPNKSRGSGVRRTGDELDDNYMEPWKSIKWDEQSILFRLPTGGVRIIQQESTRCFAVFIEDPFRAVRDQSGELTVVLSEFTSIFDSDRRHLPYLGGHYCHFNRMSIDENQSSVQQPHVITLGGAKVLDTKGRVVFHPNYVPNQFPWMMIPKLPEAKKSGSIATICALLLASRSFLSILATWDEADSTSGHHGDPGVDLLGLLKLIQKHVVKYPGSRIDARQKFTPTDRTSMLATIKRLLAIPLGMPDAIINKIATQCRSVASKLHAMKPIFYGQGSDTSELDVPYRIETHSKANSTANFLSDLTIGKDVWTGEPPDELVATVGGHTKISTGADMNMSPGTIQYHFRTRDGHSRVVDYTIVAIAITTSQHCILASPVPGVGFTPIQWTILDSKSKKLYQHCTTANLPRGTISTFLLRKCFSVLDEFRGLPSIDVDPAKVIQLLMTLDFIAPSRSVWWETWSGEEKREDEKVIVEVKQCLGGYNCECRAAASSTAESKSQSVWVILHVVTKTGDQYLSERKHKTHLNSLTTHHRPSMKMNVTKWKMNSTTKAWKAKTDAFSKGEKSGKHLWYESEGEYTLKVARLELQKFHHNTRMHHYRIDILEEVPESVYDLDDERYENTRPSSYYNQMPVQPDDLKKASCYILDRHSDLVKHIATLPRPNLPSDL